jgi:Lrp/AsnC family transcriptional regulator, leucine-responsive regulatory protein
MTLQIDRTDRHLDGLGWRILRLLQDNARLSFRQIGEAIGLTAPAVAERVRRLEDAGVIKGYHAEIDYERAGLPIMAFVHLVTNSTQSFRFRKAVVDWPEIIECHCVTGNESYILKVALTSVRHLEHLLLELVSFGEVRTSLVLSSQITRRDVGEPALTDYLSRPVRER